ncbi:hypothetical protein DFH94DRAFT_631743 [Russula ochroleuca]|jgi:hypothetical protein|uniref:Uncharacterized protein n=1 Tax=Russula ochroleuca TaxID=152965 RepID=A0A9P5T8D6_9AGAM|nr:hypothetical protein DFH94DRAFT_631743 [Russula ochroleuca]
MPPFHHSHSSCSGISQLNIFLVIINAKIKFRCYFKMVCKHPLSTPLPKDVLDLMHRTIDLVNLIYWRPIPREGTKGYEIMAELQEMKAARPQGVTGLGQEIDIKDNHGNIILTKSSVRSLARHHTQTQWLLDGDLETRKARCSALMSGHGMCLHTCSISCIFTKFWSRHQL